MKLTDALFAFSMVFTAACYGGTTEIVGTITPEVLAAIGHEALIVDVRTPEEFAAATVQNDRCVSCHA